jgi:hypothetical protein
MIEVVFTVAKCDPPHKGLHIVTGKLPYVDEDNPTIEARNALIEVLK